MKNDWYFYTVGIIIGSVMGLLVGAFFGRKRG
jgi:hypothetical protein